jgi:hypothetical protein
MVVHLAHEATIKIKKKYVLNKNKKKFISVDQISIYKGEYKHLHKLYKIILLSSCRCRYIYIYICSLLLLDLSSIIPAGQLNYLNF